MSVLTDLQAADAQSGVAVTLWDPELSWGTQRAPGDTQDNRGCPPGYGTIYTANGKVCRLISTATAAQILEDTGPGLYEQSIINIAAASEAVVGGAGQVLGAVGSVAGEALKILAPWLVIGGLVYLFVMRR